MPTIDENYERLRRFFPGTPKSELLGLPPRWHKRFMECMNTPSSVGRSEYGTVYEFVRDLLDSVTYDNFDDEQIKALVITSLGEMRADIDSFIAEATSTPVKETDDGR